MMCPLSYPLPLVQPMHKGGACLGFAALWQSNHKCSVSEGRWLKTSRIGSSASPPLFTQTYVQTSGGIPPLCTEDHHQSAAVTLSVDYQLLMAAPRGLAVNRQFVVDRRHLTSNRRRQAASKIASSCLQATV